MFYSPMGNCLGKDGTNLSLKWDICPENQGSSICVGVMSVSVIAQSGARVMISDYAALIGATF